MTAFVLGLLVFLGLHSVRIVAEGWRKSTIARFGPSAWKGVYSVLSIASFALMVWGYGQARQQMPLWDPPTFTRHVTALLMLPVFVLLVAAYVPRNHFKARLKHPMVLSVKLWAAAHLLSNGNLADVLLFGGFLLWAVLDFRAARQRDRGLMASASAALQPSASGVNTGICIAIGLVLYVAFVFGLHQWLIGVRPY